MAAGGLAAAGIVTQIAGGILQSHAAKMRQKRLKAMINEPGLDIGGITGESLDVMGDMMPRGQAIGRELDTYNQDQLEAILNKSIPGYNEIQTTRTQQALDYLKGEIPQDVQDAIYRSSAAKAGTQGTLGGGGSGSDYLRKFRARDFGLTSMDLMGKGQQYAQNIISGTPRATPTNISGLIGFTPQQLAALRAHERDQKLAAMLGYANAPGATAIAGQTATDIGSSMTGMGMGMMGGGGGGFGGMMGGGGGFGGGQMADPSAMAWYNS